MKIKKIASIFSISAFLLVGATGSLFAESYQGGTWNHGSNVSSVWSEYYHSSVTHYAAIKEVGGTCTDDSAGSGSWATATQGQNPLTDQIAYAGHGTGMC